VSDTPLLPGPLYGLRTWRVVVVDGEERITAPHRGTPWTAGPDWLEATCAEGHPAPASGCLCGIHGWHPRRSAARRVLASRFDLPGIVEAGGAVEVHEEGFRAERGRPYAFIRLPGRNPFLVDRLGEAYGAEVLDVRRPEDLLAVCRERGLGLSEPVVEGLLGADVVRERRRARRRRQRVDRIRLGLAVVIALALFAMSIAFDLRHAGTPGGPQRPAGVLAK
jgi:hypothetical protein